MTSPYLVFALAGIETGVLGGAAMCAWFTLSAMMRGLPAWVIPNLAASLVYGRTVLRSSFGMPSIVGLAVIIALAGLVGLVFGMLVGAHGNRPRIVLLGIFAGLVWYYFSQALFWRRLGILSGVQVSPVFSMAGHLIFGLVLGLYPQRLQAARGHFGSMLE
jgi:hypothetical protein